MYETDRMAGDPLATATGVVTPQEWMPQAVLSVHRSGGDWASSLTDLRNKVIKEGFGSGQAWAADCAAAVAVEQEIFGELIG